MGLLNSLNLTLIGCLSSNGYKHNWNLEIVVQTAWWSEESTATGTNLKHLPPSIKRFRSDSASRKQRTSKTHKRMPTPIRDPKETEREIDGTLTLLLSHTHTLGCSQNSRRPSRCDACIIIKAKFQVISVILREAGSSFDSRFRSPL